MRYCRTSVESFFNVAGVSARRSAGEPIDVSSGYGVAEPMEPESTVKPSVLSEHQPVRNARECGCARAKNGERRQGSRVQLLHATPGCFDADAGWKSLLV